MHSSECRRYADECMRLAREVAPEHRKLILELADRWRKVAAQLSAHETQTGRTSSDL